MELDGNVNKKMRENDGTEGALDVLSPTKNEIRRRLWIK